MRVLLARVSILSVCVLAVSAAPARGQSPTLSERAAERSCGQDRGRSDESCRTRLAAQPALEEMTVYDQAIGNAREGVGEQGGQRRDRCHAERRRRKGRQRRRR